MIVSQPLEISDLGFGISLASPLHLDGAGDQFRQRPTDQFRHVEVVVHDGERRGKREHLAERDVWVLGAHKPAKERQPVWCQRKGQQRQLDERQDGQGRWPFEVFQKLKRGAGRETSSVPPRCSSPSSACDRLKDDDKDANIQCTLRPLIVDLVLLLDLLDLGRLFLLVQYFA